MSKSRHSYDDFEELDTNEYPVCGIGKFESEPPWVPALWDRAMGGFSDVSVHDGSMVIDGFRLDDGLAALTGLEAAEDRYVCLWSDDQGFVSHMVMTQDELYACEGMDVGEFDDLGGESGF